MALPHSSSETEALTSTSSVYNNLPVPSYKDKKFANIFHVDKSVVEGLWFYLKYRIERGTDVEKNVYGNVLRNLQLETEEQLKNASQKQLGAFSLMMMRRPKVFFNSDNDFTLSNDKTGKAPNGRAGGKWNPENRLHNDGNKPGLIENMHWDETFFSQFLHSNIPIDQKTKNLEIYSREVRKKGKTEYEPYVKSTALAYITGSRQEQRNNDVNDFMYLHKKGASSFKGKPELEHLSKIYARMLGLPENYFIDRTDAAFNKDGFDEIAYKARIKKTLFMELSYQNSLQGPVYIRFYHPGCSKWWADNSDTLGLCKKNISEDAIKEILEENPDKFQNIAAINIATDDHDVLQEAKWGNTPIRFIYEEDSEKLPSQFSYCRLAALENWDPMSRLGNEVYRGGPEVTFNASRDPHGMYVMTGECYEKVCAYQARQLEIIEGIIAGTMQIDNIPAEYLPVIFDSNRLLQESKLKISPLQLIHIEAEKSQTFNTWVIYNKELGIFYKRIASGMHEILVQTQKNSNHYIKIRTTPNNPDLYVAVDKNGKRIFTSRDLKASVESRLSQNEAESSKSAPGSIPHQTTQLTNQEKLDLLMQAAKNIQGNFSILADNPEIFLWKSQKDPNIYGIHFIEGDTVYALDNTGRWAFSHPKVFYSIEGNEWNSNEELVKREIVKILEKSSLNNPIALQSPEETNKLVSEMTVDKTYTRNLAQTIQNIAQKCKDAKTSNGQYIALPEGDIFGYGYLDNQKIFFIQVKNAKGEKYKIGVTEEKTVIIQKLDSNNLPDKNTTQTFRNHSSAAYKYLRSINLENVVDVANNFDKPKKINSAPSTVKPPHLTSKAVPAVEKHKFHGAGNVDKKTLVCLWEYMQLQIRDGSDVEKKVYTAFLTKIGIETPNKFANASEKQMQVLALRLTSRATQFLNPSNDYTLRNNELGKAGRGRKGKWDPQTREHTQGNKPGLDEYLSWDEILISQFYNFSVKIQPKLEDLEGYNHNPSKFTPYRKTVNFDFRVGARFENGNDDIMDYLFLTVQGNEHLKADAKLHNISRIYAKALGLPENYFLKRKADAFNKKGMDDTAYRARMKKTIKELLVYQNSLEGPRFIQFYYPGAGVWAMDSAYQCTVMDQVMKEVLEENDGKFSNIKAIRLYKGKQLKSNSTWGGVQIIFGPGQLTEALPEEYSNCKLVSVVNWDGGSATTNEGNSPTSTGQGSMDDHAAYCMKPEFLKELQQYQNHQANSVTRLINDPSFNIDHIPDYLLPTVVDTEMEILHARNKTPPLVELQDKGLKLTVGKELNHKNDTSIPEGIVISRNKQGVCVSMTIEKDQIKIQSFANKPDEYSSKPKKSLDVLLARTEEFLKKSFPEKYTEPKSAAFSNFDEASSFANLISQENTDKLSQLLMLAHNVSIPENTDNGIALYKHDQVILTRNTNNLCSVQLVEGQNVYTYDTTGRYGHAICQNIQTIQKNEWQNTDTRIIQFKINALLHNIETGQILLHQGSNLTQEVIKEEKLMLEKMNALIQNISYLGLQVQQFEDKRYIRFDQIPFLGAGYSVSMAAFYIQVLNTAGIPYEIGVSGNEIEISKLAENLKDKIDKKTLKNNIDASAYLSKIGLENISEELANKKIALQNNIDQQFVRTEKGFIMHIASLNKPSGDLTLFTHNEGTIVLTKEGKICYRRVNVADVAIDLYDFPKTVYSQIIQEFNTRFQVNPSSEQKHVSRRQNPNAHIPADTLEQDSRDSGEKNPSTSTDVLSDPPSGALSNSEAASSSPIISNNLVKKLSPDITPSGSSNPVINPVINSSFKNSLPRQNFMERVIEILAAKNIKLYKSDIKIELINKGDKVTIDLENKLFITNAGTCNEENRVLDLIQNLEQIDMNSVRITSNLNGIFDAQGHEIGWTNSRNSNLTEPNKTKQETSVTNNDSVAASPLPKPASPSEFEKILEKIQAIRTMSPSQKIFVTAIDQYIHHVDGNNQALEFNICNKDPSIELSCNISSASDGSIIIKVRDLASTEKNYIPATNEQKTFILSSLETEQKKKNAIKEQIISLAQQLNLTTTPRDLNINNINLIYDTSAEMESQIQINLNNKVDFNKRQQGYQSVLARQNTEVSEIVLRMDALRLLCNSIKVKYSKETHKDKVDDLIDIIKKAIDSKDYKALYKRWKSSRLEEIKDKPKEIEIAANQILKTLKELKGTAIQV